MKRMEDFLQGKRRALIAGSALLVLLIMVDVSTNSELNLSPLYLAPDLLVTWYVGTAWGVSFAVVAILVSVVIGIWTGHHYSHAFYFYFHIAGKVFSLLVFLWVVKLASRLRRAHDLERAHARTDFLTGIANRAAFFEALAREIERDRRHHHPFTLIFLDCDNFKAVNDQLGHAIGDGLLRVVAETLVSAVRKTDLVARLGGDEFIALMPETDVEQCGELVKQLSGRLDDAMRSNKWPVSFSIGVAVFPHAPDSADQAIEFVDSLMYQAKNAGKHRIAQASYAS